MNNFIYPFLFLALFVISCKDSNNSPANGNILGNSQSTSSKVESSPEMSSAKSVAVNSSDTKQSILQKKNFSKIVLAH